MSWGEELGGDFVKLPVGAEVTIEVKAINKITDRPDYNFKTKDKDLGYYYEFETDQGILTVNTFAMSKALKMAGVDVGSQCTIKHTGTGSYECSKIEAV